MDQLIKKILSQPTMLRHLGLLFIGFVLGMLLFVFINFEQSQNVIQLLSSGCLGVLVVYTIFYSNSILNKLLDWKRQTGLRILLGIVWNSTTSFVLTWLGVWIFSFAKKGTSMPQVMNMEQSLKLGILLFCSTVIYNIFYFTYYSYNQYAVAQLSELKGQRKQAELQLATLKSQLSPHFLFNAINSLSVLFHDNTQKAETFIRSMAKSYQYTLDNCRRSLIFVKDELDFVNSYTFLLSTRFGDAFRLKIELNDHHLNSKIPPLTLQLLVENAIKHNLVSAAHPLEVHITGNGDSLVVSNNRIAKKQTPLSTGIGLKNIIGRYKMLSELKIKMEDGSRFTVTLPLLKDE